MTKVFENGILMGWNGTVFNQEGHAVKVFIPRRDEDIAQDRARRTARTATAKISFDGCTYYISFLNRGTRSRKSYKTEAGARRAADRLGEVVDAAPAQYVLPIYLDPTSETYRCA